MTSRRAVYKPPPSGKSGAEKVLTTLANTLYGKPLDDSMKYQDTGFSKSKLKPSGDHDDGLTLSQRLHVYGKDLENILDDPVHEMFGDDVDDAAVTSGVVHGRRPNKGFRPQTTGGTGVKPLSNAIPQGINGTIYDLGLPVDEEGVPEGNSTWQEQKIPKVQTVIPRTNKPVDRPHKDPAPPVNPALPKKPKKDEGSEYIPLPLDDAGDWVPEPNPKPKKKFKQSTVAIEDYGKKANTTSLDRFIGGLPPSIRGNVVNVPMNKARLEALEARKHKRKRDVRQHVEYSQIAKELLYPHKKGAKKMTPAQKDLHYFNLGREAAGRLPIRSMSQYRHTPATNMPKRYRSRAPSRKPMRRAPARRQIVRKKSRRSAPDPQRGLYNRYASLGSFPVSQNSLVRTSLKPSLVFNKVSKPSSVRVRHREYVMDIIGGSSATLDLQIPIKINSGLERSFPWLSAIAAGFETFKFHGLVYEFKSLSGDVTSGSNQGFCCAAIDYNPTSPTWTTKAQIENAEGSVSAKPSKDFMIVAECAPAINTTQEFYTTQGALTAFQPPSLYQLGELNIATGGLPTSGAILYELWVAYDVEMSCPHQLPSGASTLSAHYNLGILAAASPLGLEANRTQAYDNIGLTVSNTVITLPPGVGGGWQMTIFSAGTAAACSPPSITYGNCTGKNIWLTSAANQNYEATETGVNTTTYIALATFTVTNPQLPATVTFGGAGAYPTGTVQTDLVITELSPYLVL